jgi:hypothetical protein
MDCFVATLLAMTEEAEIRPYFRHTVPVVNA